MSGEPPPSIPPGAGAPSDVATQVAAMRGSLSRTLTDLSGVSGLLQALDRELASSGGGTPDPAAAGARLDDACLKLVEVVRQRCPGLLPAQPLQPGTPGGVVPIVTKSLAQLAVSAARTAAEVASSTGPVRGGDVTPASVIWGQGADELLVLLSEIDLRVSTGLVLVMIPVACDQLPDGRDVVTVPFAVGSPERPTGLYAATERHPRGPAAVVARWGDALVALAWQALLDLTAGVAAASGVDTDGAPLVPAALAATPDGLAVLPQARHPFDRVLPVSARQASSAIIAVGRSVR